MVVRHHGETVINWEAIGAFAELLAAIGAIVAIVYLALQLRHNTEALERTERAARAATSFQGAHSWADINLAVLDPPNLAVATAASFDDNPPSFSDEDEARLFFVARSVMERLDALHYLYRNEQLEEELWQVRVTWARRWISRPYWKAWWEGERETSNYSPSFIVELEREPSDGGPT